MATTKVSIDKQVQSELPVASGGTGAATLADHGVLLGSGTSAVSVTGAGTSGQILTSNGASSDPTFQDAGGGGGGMWTFVETITFSGSSTQQDSSVFSSPGNAMAYKVLVDIQNDHTASNTVRMWLNGLTGSIYSYARIQWTAFAGSALNNANGLHVWGSQTQDDTLTGVIIIGNRKASDNDRLPITADLGSTATNSQLLFKGYVDMGTETSVDQIGFSAAGGNITGTFKIFRHDT